MSGRGGSLTDAAVDAVDDRDQTDVSRSDSGLSDVAAESHDESVPEAVAAVCGDGIQTQLEECDLGAAANTGAYGGCTKDCKLAPRCGDGKVNDVSEVCDDGADNGFAVGNCNLACSGKITEKTIRATEPTDLSGIEDADLVCENYVGSNYRALLVDGTTRVASETPYRGDGEVDWVLLPYTRYVNESGSLVWVTDSVPLLAVRNGQVSPLLNPILPGPYSLAWGGYDRDWTTSADTCERWFSTDKADSGAVVRLDLQTWEIDSAECDLRRPMLCVERY